MGDGGTLEVGASDTGIFPFISVIDPPRRQTAFARPRNLNTRIPKGSCRFAVVAHPFRFAILSIVCFVTDGGIAGNTGRIGECVAYAVFNRIAAAGDRAAGRQRYVEVQRNAVGETVTGAVFPKYEVRERNAWAVSNQKRSGLWGL